MPRLTSGRTLEEHREHMQEQILDAFEEVLAEKGWDAVTMREVASRAGATRTVVYNYHADRTALLVAWSDREMDRFLDLCERELAERSDPVERLDLLTTLVLTEYSVQRGPTADIHGVLSPKDQAALDGHAKPLHEAVAFVLRSGNLSGQMDCDDAETAGRVILAALETERPTLHGGGRLDESVARIQPVVRRIAGVGPGV
ncbi:DNA-binding transcriptional regulator, AcrR family [Paraoerskovia marina]|uniref:DNA-binding transcriptional regulator, AcrR family n=1 Tax=Paraoerskovia marina TaxID=545619 RepID=A0A1H1QLG4_9CELL|nr:TetR/AcrR family transcriptional regulator [Paraoerskovia marina]SDS24312.1 DNA-binding transcriptional regulator, AcrR family [Paraoerskovia marina]